MGGSLAQVGYHYAAAATDNIAANGPAAWTTKMTVLARLACANGSANTQRGIVYADSFFFDFPGGSGTPADNAIRIGYQDSASAFPLITATSNFLTGVIHTVIAVIDTTLGSANLKLYVDTSSTPLVPSSGSGNSTLSPLATTTGLKIGGDAATASFDGNLYEAAYWPTIALTGAQCAQLGGGDATGIPLPAHYWDLIADPNDMFGGKNGVVTGASVQAHVGKNLWPLASIWQPLYQRSPVLAQ